MLDFVDIESKLQGKGQVWVRLYDGTKICLVGVVNSTTFKAKFIPCARNAREYVVKHNEVKEFIVDNVKGVS